jgi:hypothetical protein
VGRKTKTLQPLAAILSAGGRSFQFKLLALDLRGAALTVLILAVFVVTLVLAPLFRLCGLPTVLAALPSLAARLTGLVARLPALSRLVTLLSVLFHIVCHE